MSELMNMPRRNIRWELMATVSGLALFSTLHGVGEARAADNNADRPTVWIELGVQSEQVNGFGNPFAPPFDPKIVADGFTSPEALQRALSQSFGGESRISFQPENSDWVFSASVLYGRANGRKATHEQTPGGSRVIHLGSHSGPFYPIHSTVKFSQARVDNNETHTVLDFQVGKDIGLGLFNAAADSTLSFGVRFAQFTSKQTLGLIANPDFHFPTNAKYEKYHHTYTVTSHMDRSFHGFGPSLSWDASAPLVGNVSDGRVAFDWGANVAVLFGRQKVRGQHKTSAVFYKTNAFLGYHLTTHFQRSGNPDRSRFVTVPNLGGFAGVSFLYSNAKVSLGYRADFFFGAMDGGIDTARTENRGFYGPFATISVGLGG